VTTTTIIVIAAAGRSRADASIAALLLAAAAQLQAPSGWECVPRSAPGPFVLGSPFSNFHRNANVVMDVMMSRRRMCRWDRIVDA
jgi:hypothetical protein